MTTETTEAPSTALTVAERAAVALGAAEHEIKLRDLAKQSTEIVAITNKASYDQCHATRMSLKRARIAIESTGKQAREDAQAFAKAVIAEEKRLIGIIAPEETRLQTIQDAHDAEVERKKAEAAAAERERVERIQAGIRDIRGALLDVAGRASSAIEEKIRELVALEINAETCQEFEAEAEATREQTLAKLRDLHASTLHAEQEAARLKAEREELERQKAEQAAREREAAERAAAAEAERRQKIEAEERAARERIEAQEREARDRREAEERELQEKRERIAAEARALEEQQRQEREAREERERQARLEQEERERTERLAREQAEREEREKAEAEQREREEYARRERDAEAERVREAQRIEAEHSDIRAALGTLRGRVTGMDEFAWFAKAYDAAMKPKRAAARAKAAA